MAGQCLGRHRQSEGDRLLGLKGETHWMHIEIFEGSYGGRLGKDGMDAVDTLYANTRNNPIEVYRDPALARAALRLREDVAGAGKWRGGLGSVREFTFLIDGGASVEGEGHRHRPWGFLGGSGPVQRSGTLRSTEASRLSPSQHPSREHKRNRLKQHTCEKREQVK
jgi:N-methylhydantoinase B